MPDNNDFPTPSKTGYKFLGWYYKREISNELYNVMPFMYKEENSPYTSYVEKDMTLVATWLHDSDTIYVDTVNGVNLCDYDDTNDVFIFGDGSEDNPLKSIDMALMSIGQFNNPTRDYTIVIDGMAEEHNLIIDDSIPANSITLQGKSEPASGEDPSDGILHSDVMYTTPTYQSLLVVSTSTPVVLRNIKIEMVVQGYETDGLTLKLSSGANVTLDEGATFVGSGSQITPKGVIAVEDGASLIMNEGAVIKGFGLSHGAVYVKEGGNFTMNGGSIINNFTYDGGAVHISGGTFEMNGGSISENTTQCQNYLGNTELYGAGVCLVSGTFTMNDGYIKNNKAYVYNSTSGLTTAGGGVFVHADGSFEMTGGQISGNAAIKADINTPDTIIDGDYAYGGGVCLQASGNKLASFTMTGGTISGNTAGTSGNGIGFLGSLAQGATGSISLGADAIITDNDIYLPSNVTIKIVESMTGGLDPEIRATITPQEYKVNQPIFSDESVNLGVEYTYFAVTPQGSTTWTLNEEGKLVSSGAGNDPYTNPSSYTVITGGTIEQVIGGGSIENECDSNNTIITIPSLYVANSLVTRAEYETYMNYYGTNTPTGEADTPVYYVSWIDAIIYCNLRSIAEQKEPVYSLGGETDPDSPDWTNYYITSYENRYWYNSNEDADSWDTEVGVFDFNLDADGYRLMTSAECRYISENYQDFFAGATMDEWTQTYSAGYEAQRLYYSYVDRTCVGKLKGNATRESTLGFRVVHKVPSNP